MQTERPVPRRNQTAWCVHSSLSLNEEKERLMADCSLFVRHPRPLAVLISHSCPRFVPSSRHYLKRLTGSLSFIDVPYCTAIKWTSISNPIPCQDASFRNKGCNLHKREREKKIFKCLLFLCSLLCLKDVLICFL